MIRWVVIPLMLAASACSETRWHEPETLGVSLAEYGDAETVRSSEFRRIVEPHLADLGAPSGHCARPQYRQHNDQPDRFFVRCSRFVYFVIEGDEVVAQFTTTDGF